MTIAYAALSIITSIGFPGADNAWESLNSYANNHNITIFVDSPFLPRIERQDKTDTVEFIAKSADYITLKQGNILVFKRNTTKPYVFEVTKEELKKLLDIPILKSKWARKDIGESAGVLRGLLSPEQNQVFRSSAIPVRSLTPNQQEIVQGMVIGMGYPRVVQESSLFSNVFRALNEDESEIYFQGSPNGESESVRLRSSTGHITVLGRHKIVPVPMVRMQELHVLTRQSAISTIKDTSISELVSKRTLSQFGDQHVSMDDLPLLNKLFDSSSHVSVDPITGDRKIRLIPNHKPKSAGNTDQDSFMAAIPEQFYNITGKDLEISSFRNVIGSFIHDEVQKLASENSKKGGVVRIKDLSVSLLNALNAYSCLNLCAALYESATKIPPIVIKERNNLYISGEDGVKLGERPASAFYMAVKLENGNLFKISGTVTVN